MRFKSIDSLRGIAAIAVVFFHVWGRFYPDGSTQKPPWVVPHGLGPHTAFFGFGYLGVNLFFVLSGLCIHLPQAIKFHATGSDQLRLKSFAKRRFFRLYPAYFASLAWTSLVLLAIPTFVAFAKHEPLHFAAVADVRSFVASAFFAQQIYPPAFNFNGVYWTLVFETQFYLLYPVLLWLCRRAGFMWPLLALLGCEIFFTVHPVSLKAFVLTRYFEWFLGMLLAERIASRKPINMPAFVFPVLLAMAVGCVFTAATLPYRDILASTAFACLLAVCLEREARMPWLTRPWLVAVGVFSYSVYLTHVPMNDLFWSTVRLIRTRVPALPQATEMVSVPVIFVFGYLFFRYFERPFLGAKKKEGDLPAGPREQAW